MAEIGVSIAEKLIEVIGSAVVKEICDIWGYRSELEGLNKTVNTIKNVLRDADSKRELTHTERGYVQELKAVVYDADDLFDEFFTLAELNQLNGNIKGDDDKFFKKVRRFFSSKKKGMTQAYRMSQRVKEIKQQLDSVANNFTKYKVSFDTKPIRQRRKETFSYLTNTRAMVGREDDKNTVLNKLLAPNIDDDDDDDDDVRFLTIVGVGGVGKTTLAKLVFNDAKVVAEFPDPNLRLWVCVSDQDGENFDVKAILSKILSLVSNGDTCTMEEVQKLFLEKLQGRKYFLVLDDVWNEHRDEWLILESMLKIGHSGSRVLITTRSEKTASIIGNKLLHRLGGLSPENSWELFKILAFEKDDYIEKYVELVEIGRRIVPKCHNVPLAIEVLASLLYGNEVTKWRSFEDIGLSEIGNGDNKIMSILKLSYHNLEYSLKSCFSYCAIFPKDTIIEKDDLISLWLAQGYIVPLNGGQSLEDAAEEYFLTLLQRCFFQNVKVNEYDDVVSVEIHDLMHDVAQEVGLPEICISICDSSNMGDEIRHVRCNNDILYSFDDDLPKTFAFKSEIRSFICDLHGLQAIKPYRIDKWKCLRVLDLRCSKFLRQLPDWIGKLLHLRYLNVSYNRKLKTLPDSINELHNLQTLRLSFCKKFETLPDIGKLVKLRHLDLKGCPNLRNMPASLGKLTNLTQLSRVTCFGEFGLESLKCLTNIKGEIIIDISGNGGIQNDTGGYLKSMKCLSQVVIMFHSLSQVEDERMMEKLEPHSNIKGVALVHYEGGIIPRWGITQSNWENTFPLLVSIELAFCQHLVQIPSLSKLQYLKRLELCHLPKFLHVEDTSHTISRMGGEDYQETFFPSLETLIIMNLGSLKGWWRGDGLFEEEKSDPITAKSFGFPRLSHLRITECPNLTSFPRCHRIEELVIDTVENLKSIFIVTDQSNISDDRSQIPWKSLNHSLRSLEFRNLKDTPFPTATSGMQYLTSLQFLKYKNSENLDDPSEWIGKLSSLQKLVIDSKTYFHPFDLQ